MKEQRCEISSDLSDLFQEINSIDSDIHQIEKELKEIEIERLDNMGYFQTQFPKKQQHFSVEEEYSLRNKLPFEYVENYNIFRSGTQKKFNLRIDHKVRNVEFMQIKTNKSSGGVGSGSNDFTNQYIMIVFTENNYILLLDFKGRIMHEYYAGHNIYKYATLQSNDEQSIYTLGDDFSIKYHMIRPLRKQDIEWIQKSDNETQSSIIRIKSSKEIKVIEKPTNSTQQKEKKVKQLNLLIEYEGEFNINKPVNSTQDISEFYTAFEVYLQKSNRYVMIGDQTGHIHVYFKNGTKVGKSSLSRHPITQILKHYPYPLYATKNQIGFFNQGTLHTAYPQCDQNYTFTNYSIQQTHLLALIQLIIELLYTIEINILNKKYQFYITQTYDDILYLTIDGQHSQNIFVLQKNMEILIYDIKSQKSSCSILMKLNSGDIDEIEKKDQSKVTIQQLHNYIIFQSYDTPITKVLNITNFKSKNADFMLDIGFYFSGMGSQQYQLDYFDEQGHFSYQTHKHSSNYGILAYFEHLHQPAGTTEISVYVVHTQSPSWNFSENFKMPVIAIILIVFFFISYCRKKKKPTLDDVSMANIDNLIKDIQSGKKTIPNYKKGE